MLEVSIEQAIQAPAQTGLSSLKVIDDRLKSRYTGAAATVEIEGWWMGLCMLTRTVLTYIWTREGQLHMEANYNEAFYEKSLCGTVVG